jgi:DNA polymerase III gamma/tau subunit
VRDALSLLDKLLSIGPDADSKTANILLGVTDFGLHNQLFLMIKNGQTQLLPKFFEQLMADGTDFQIFNKDFLQYLRQALVLSVTKESLNIGLTENEQKELENSISEITSSSILLIIRLFLRSFKDMAQTPSPELPMLLASIEASIGLSKPITVKIDTIPDDVPVAKTVSTEKKLNIDKLVQTPTTDQASLAVSNSEVEAFWPEVVSAIKTINSPLATLIKNSPIALVDKGVITLEVKYQFHKEHIESNKHYALITGIIEQVSGKRMALSIIVRSPEQNVQTPTEVLGSVLQVFGGELVE